MAFKPTAGGTYRLQSSIGGSDTTLTLTSFTEPVSGTLYTMAYLGSTIEYATLEPQSTSKEIISFTGITQNADGTATLTGVTRGLSFSTPYTAVVALQQPHSGQSILILSDAPQLFNQYAIKGNDETITGSWTFNAFPVTPSTPLATTAVAGFTEIAIQAEVIAKTATGGTGGSLTVTPALLASVLLSDYKIDTGAANAYVITPAPAITAYTAGQIFSFKATHANTTTSTLNVNGLGVQTIKLANGANLFANAILNGQLVVVQYDGTNFQMISQPGAATATSGAFTKDMSSSTTTTIGHGLGSIPSCVRISGVFGLVVNATDNLVSQTQTIYTTSQSSNSLALYTGGSGNGAVTISQTFRLSGSAALSQYIEGVVTTDITNITITWTKTSTPTGTADLTWVAFR